MALWLTCTLSLLGLTFVVADAAAPLGIGAVGPSTAPFQHCTPDAELVSVRPCISYRLDYWYSS